MLEVDGNRYCDRCGVLLTEKNNKCGYELCDTCNMILENQKKYVLEYTNDYGILKTVLTNKIRINGVDIKEILHD